MVDSAWGPAEDDVCDRLVTTPRIEALHLLGTMASNTFLRPDPLSDTKLLPSLRHLRLKNIILESHGDWNPLITYLARRTSGGQPISFMICGKHPPVPPEVVKVIEGLVEEFSIGSSEESGW